MDVRYYFDPDTGQPHIYGHGVTETEVEYVLRHPGEDRPDRDDSRHALGQTQDGRYLRVIYVPDPGSEAFLSSPRMSCGASRSRHIVGEEGGGGEDE